MGFPLHGVRAVDFCRPQVRSRTYGVPWILQNRETFGVWWLHPWFEFKVYWNTRKMFPSERYCSFCFFDLGFKPSISWLLCILEGIGKRSSWFTILLENAPPNVFMVVSWSLLAVLLNKNRTRKIVCVCAFCETVVDHVWNLDERDGCMPSPKLHVFFATWNGTRRKKGAEMSDTDHAWSIVFLKALWILIWCSKCFQWVLITWSHSCICIRCCPERLMTQHKVLTEIFGPATRSPAKAGCISELYWPVAQIGCWAPGES